MGKIPKKEKVSSGKTLFQADIARMLAKKIGINIGDMNIILDELAHLIGQCAINKDTIKIVGLGNLENIEYFATKTRYGENNEKITKKEKICKYIFTISDKIDDIKNRPHLTEQRYGINCENYVHWDSEPSQD